LRQDDGHMNRPTAPQLVRHSQPEPPARKSGAPPARPGTGVTASMPPMPSRPVPTAPPANHPTSARNVASPRIAKAPTGTSGHGLPLVQPWATPSTQCLSKASQDVTETPRQGPVAKSRWSCCCSSILSTGAPTPSRTSSNRDEAIPGWRVFAQRCPDSRMRSPAVSWRCRPWPRPRFEGRLGSLLGPEGAERIARAMLAFKSHLGLGSRFRGPTSAKPLRATF
jgi:hypothetical protein